MIMKSGSSPRIFRAFFVCLFVGCFYVSFVFANETRQKESKHLVKVGADYNYPPYEFRDENGQPAGYNVELTYAIAEMMGINVDITLTDWDSAYAGLLDGTFDVLQGIAYSDKRAQLIRFSSPHSIVNQSIFARKDEPELSDMKALSGKEVLVQRNSIMHEYLSQNIPDAIPIPVATHSEALRTLASGKYDFALTANLPSLYLSAELGLTNIHAVASPVSGQRLGYGVLPQNEDIISLFSEGLSILKNTGRQQEIYDKWLGALDQSKVQWEKIRQYTLYTIAVLLLVLGGIVIWNHMLRKEVERRSAQLKAQHAQLIQADKMTSLGVLVSGIAHEINNPTGLLLLNLPILKDAWMDAEPLFDELEKSHDSLYVGGLPYQRLKKEIPYLFDEMLQSADRIRNIVNDLKDFVRAQPDEVTQNVDLNAAVSSAVRLVEKSIRSNIDEFELHLDNRTPMIQGNLQRIEQVIINLIINACDAMADKKGALRVSTAISLKGLEVLIVVEDEGVGIEADVLPHLVDPFFTTKREQGGTGLGLSVSSGIIKNHQGSLSFQSQVGKGTTVTVTLPLVKVSSELR
jgi:two-component system NtrC family sensor kinase